MAIQLLVLGKSKKKILVSVVKLITFFLIRLEMMSVGGDGVSGTASNTTNANEQQSSHSSHSSSSHTNNLQSKMTDILKRKAPPKRKSQPSSRSKSRNQDHGAEQSSSVMQDLMSKASALGKFVVEQKPMHIQWLMKNC